MDGGLTVRPTSVVDAGERASARMPTPVRDAVSTNLAAVAEP